MTRPPRNKQSVASVLDSKVASDESFTRSAKNERLMDRMTNNPTDMSHKHSQTRLSGGKVTVEIRNKKHSGLSTEEPNLSEQFVQADGSRRNDRESSDELQGKKTVSPTLPYLQAPSGDITPTDFGNRSLGRRVKEKSKKKAKEKAKSYDFPITTFISRSAIIDEPCKLVGCEGSGKLRLVVENYTLTRSIFDISQAYMVRSGKAPSRKMMVFFRQTQSTANTVHVEFGTRTIFSNFLEIYKDMLSKKLENEG